MLGVNLFFIPFTMAFDTDALLDKNRVMEFTFDIFFAINILLNFFTAFQQDIEWKYSLKEIGKSYIKSFFVFDCLSTIPTLVTYEDPNYYRFKALRYVRFFGLLKHINDILQKIFNRMGLNKQLIERIFYFFKLMLNLLFIIHILACIWCYIGRIGKGTWIDTKGQCDSFYSDYYEEVENCTGGDCGLSKPVGFEKNDIFNLYIIAVYWVITTLTTVGYGDYKGCTNNEYIF